LGGRNITASGNMISGCTTGMLLGWDNSVVTGNTMRDIADHGINFVAAESIASLTIRNNVFDRIGLESNDGSYGLMLTLGSSLTISRIDVRDNAFHVFEGATQFAFRLIHTSSGAVDKLLFADNFLDDVITGLSISTATANEIDHIEFARNSM